MDEIRVMSETETFRRVVEDYRHDQATCDHRCKCRLASLAVSGWMAHLHERRKMSMADIAELAEVSKPTVSRRIAVWRRAEAEGAQVDVSPDRKVGERILGWRSRYGQADDNPSAERRRIPSPESGVSSA